MSVTAIHWDEIFLRAIENAREKGADNRLLEEAYQHYNELKIAYEESANRVVDKVILGLRPRQIIFTWNLPEFFKLTGNIYFIGSYDRLNDRIIVLTSVDPTQILLTLLHEYLHFLLWREHIVDRELVRIIARKVEPIVKAYRDVTIRTLQMGLTRRTALIEESVVYNLEEEAAHRLSTQTTDYRYSLTMLEQALNSTIGELVGLFLPIREQINQLFIEQIMADMKRAVKISLPEEAVELLREAMRDAEQMARAVDTVISFAQSVEESTRGNINKIIELFLLK